MEWIQTELDEIQKEKGETGDFKPFLKLESGEHQIEIINTGEPPRTIEGKYNKKQKVLQVKYKGVEYDWAFSVRNPIYHQILLLLKDGKTKHHIIKTGEGIDTRYEILKK